MWIQRSYPLPVLCKNSVIAPKLHASSQRTEIGCWPWALDVCLAKWYLKWLLSSKRPGIQTRVPNLAKNNKPVFQILPRLDNGLLGCHSHTPHTRWFRATSSWSEKKECGNELSPVNAAGSQQCRWWCWLWWCYLLESSGSSGTLWDKTININFPRMTLIPCQAEWMDIIRHFQGTVNLLDHHYYHHHSALVKGHYH